ncbi:MAG: hypothetical protein RJA70_4435 [Pseudomonadota bacterium]|jgi:transglutaminase-like putative cysteine protease
MRFGLVHRIMTDALAALGMLSLMTSGDLDPKLVAVTVSGLAVAMLVPQRWQAHPRMRTFSVVASLSLLASQALRLMWGFDVLQVAVEFAAGLQLIRLSTRRGAAHDQQIILLALLHLVAGTVFGGGMAYGLCFLGFLIIAPGALVLSHLRREVEGNYRQGAKDRTGLPVDVPRILRSRRVISRGFLLATCSLSIPIFLFTALLFVLFPRVGLSLLLMQPDRSERMVGFSDRVDLGKVGRLRADTTIALRVYLPQLSTDPPQRIPLYLRGTAFDHYDGSSWSRDKTQVQANRVGSRVWVGRLDVPHGPERMSVDLLPIKPPVIFLPSEATAFEVLSTEDKLLGRPPRITAGREGDFEYVSSEERGLRYTVFGAPPNRSDFDRLLQRDAERYLSIPRDLPPRVHELARTWAGDAQAPEAMAQRIEQRLRSDYRYDLDSPSGATLNPLDHFLFESKRGHCEFYSTSMAILLRTLGVPTRNVTGFAGGTYNRFGEFYAVRQGDAHSWVEVYLDHKGWTTFDPTPTAESQPRADVDGLVATLRDLLEATGERWNRHIIGYDLDQQLSMLRDVRKRLPQRDSRSLDEHRRTASYVVLALVLGTALFWFYQKRRQRQQSPRPIKPLTENALRVVGLYRKLEDALQQHGVPRSPDCPPLAHARALVETRHTLGPEVLALTEVYLAARFGDAVLTADDASDFARRVKALKPAPETRAA